MIQISDSALSDCDELIATFEKLSAKAPIWALVHDSDFSQTVVLGDVTLSEEHSIRLASVSKLVLGRIYAALLEKGQLSPDAAVYEFYKKYQHRLSDLRVDDLARHNTGLRDALESKSFRDKINEDVTAHVSIDEIIYRSLIQDLVQDRPNYKNINAILLAGVLEQVTGRALKELIAHHLPNVPGLHFDTKGGIPKPYPVGYRFGSAPGFIEYGSELYRADHYNASWGGASGAMTLQIKDIPIFANAVLEPIAEFAEGQTEGFAALANLEPEWIYHPGDVPGFSAWAGLHRKTGRKIFAAAGLSWVPDLGNPAELLAHSICKSD